MGEGSPSSLFMAIIAFIAVIAGLFSIISYFAEVQPSFIESTTNFTNLSYNLNKYDELELQVDSMRSSVENSSITSDYGALGSLVSTGWGVLKGIPRVLLASGAFVYEIISSVGGYFGIPSWATGLMIITMTVIIIFTIYSAVFQREV